MKLHELVDKVTSDLRDATKHFVIAQEQYREQALKIITRINRSQIKEVK